MNILPTKMNDINSYFEILLTTIIHNFIDLLLKLYNFILDLPSLIFLNPIYSLVIKIAVSIVIVLAFIKLIMSQIQFKIYGINNLKFRGVIYYFNCIAVFISILSFIFFHKSLYNLGLAICNYYSESLNLTLKYLPIDSTNSALLQAPNFMELGYSILVSILLLIILFFIIYLFVQMILRLINYVLISVSSPVILINVIQGNTVNVWNWVVAVLRIVITQAVQVIVLVISFNLLMFSVRDNSFSIVINYCLLVFVVYGTVLVPTLLKGFNTSEKVDNEIEIKRTLIVLKQLFLGGS